jgi:hypothetical protein
MKALKMKRKIRRRKGKKKIVKSPQERKKGKIRK